MKMTRIIAIIGLTVSILYPPARAQSLPPLDQYGGRSDIPCVNSTGVYITVKIGGHQWFCDPAGHAQILMAVSMNAPNGNPTYDCANKSLGTATSATWSGGVATYTFSTPLPANAIVGSELTTTGFTPAGYNLAYCQSCTTNRITAVSGGQISVAMSVNPGTNSILGTGASYGNSFIAYAAKYAATGDPGGTTYNYAWQTEKRLQSLSFNTTGNVSVGQFFPWNTCSGCTWPGGVQPINLPAIFEIHATLYAAEYQYGYTQPIKDEVWGQSGIWSSVYNAIGVGNPDIFDPNEKTLWTGLVGDANLTILNKIVNNTPWVPFLVTDDTDSFVGFNSGPDFVNAASGSNLGLLTVITSPFQTFGGHNSNLGGDYLYSSDIVVHAKAQSTNPVHGTCSISAPCSLRDFLYDEYSGSITSLNTAWGSSYSSFDSSGVCVGYTLPFCGSQAASESVTLSGGSYTLANANISPRSVQILLVPQSPPPGFTSAVVTGDCPWMNGYCGAASGNGTFKIPKQTSSITGWSARTGDTFFPVGYVFIDSNNDVEYVLSTTNSSGTHGNTAASQPTWPSQVNCNGSVTAETADGQNTDLCVGPNITGTIVYGTTTAGSSRISLTIGGSGSLPTGEAIKINYISGAWGASTNGTGLVDEDGQHGGTGHNSTGWIGTNSYCLEGADTNYPTFFECTGAASPFKAVPNAHAAFGADIDNWISQFTAEYAKNFHDPLRAAGSKVMYFGIDSTGGVGSPMFSKMFTGMVPYVDGFFGNQLYNLPNSSGSYSSSKSSSLDAAYSYRTRYSQDKPQVDVSFIGGTADSDESCVPGGGIIPANEAPTQAVKGQVYYNTVNYLLTTPGFYGDTPFVGFNNMTWQDYQKADFHVVSLWDNSYGYNGITGEAQLAVTSCDSGYISLVSCGLDNANYGNSVAGAGQNIMTGNQIWLLEAAPPPPIPAPAVTVMYNRIALPIFF